MPNSPEGYVPEVARGMPKKDAEIAKYEQKIKELTEAAKDAEGEDLEIIEENIELQKKLIAATEIAEDRRKRVDSILVDIVTEDPTVDAPKPISPEEQQKMKRSEEEEIQELLKGIREHGQDGPGTDQDGGEKAA